MKNLIPKRVMEYIIITFAVVLMDVGIYVLVLAGIVEGRRLMLRLFLLCF